MSKLIKLDSLKKIDYKEVGLICGLEIHQQLNCGKLFCSCPCDIVPNETLDKEVNRRLRFSLGESGEVDKAALEEFKKGKFNVYRYNDSIACLVDLDEEPPNGPNEEALNCAIGVSKMFNLKFFDKLQFMRKLIIDGSVTSGFQRTGILGINGEFETKDGKIVIEGINLEEDSCRNIERNSDHSIFSLDRQGIPLIEITTGPQIRTPQQAYDAALYIGNVLRSFKQTRRGLGTIRQDVNVSIKGGARIEIKGAQNLKLIPDIVENEIRRQKIHLSIISELESRGSNCENFTDWEIYNVTHIFKKSESKVIKSNLEGKNKGVLAVKLFNFKGILGCEMQENFRFATEVSDRNKKHFPQVKGLFHSDELPKYGIEQKDVDKVRSELELKENDSFILIANDYDVAHESLKNVLEITSDLILQVPTEVRQVDPKGTVTRFLRPMPGAARMYPETDVHEIVLDSDLIGSVKLPELYDEKLSRISKKWSLDEIRTVQVLDKFSEEDMNELIKVSSKSAKALYEVLFEIPKDIKKRDKVEPIDFKLDLLKDILKESSENNFNQKVIRDVFLSLYKDRLSEVDNLKKYLEDKGLLSVEVDEKELEEKIKRIVLENKGAPFGALMGKAMAAFNGKVDGKKISEILRKLS